MGARINIDDEADRWRWVCPRGHRNWEPTNHHFWCQQCASLDGVDAVFDELHGLATERDVQRDKIELDTDHGRYQDVFGNGGAP